MKKFEKDNNKIINSNKCVDVLSAASNPKYRVEPQDFTSRSSPLHRPTFMLAARHFRLRKRSPNSSHDDQSLQHDHSPINSIRINNESIRLSISNRYQTFCTWMCIA